MIDVVVDHSFSYGAARDQGPRPTCIAFAVSDAHANTRKEPAQFLSCEYLFYQAAHLQLPIPHQAGVKTGAIATALLQDGQPLDADYPYQVTLDPTAALSVPPNPFPFPKYRAAWEFISFSKTGLLALLEDGHAIVLALKITEIFFLLSLDQPILTAHQNNDPVSGCHAVVAVGYGTDCDGKPYVKIRNSWGECWGDKGCAWIPVSYVENQLVWMARLFCEAT